MNATMVASGTKAVPPPVSSIQDIPIAKIRESKTNPRRFFDEAKLAELADNIRQHGVLQPILLRPLPEGEAGTYELVAGTRRYRASRLAKRESIPATVRELTDAQALELQVCYRSSRTCSAWTCIRSMRRRDTPPSSNFNPTLTPSKPSPHELADRPRT